MSEVSSVAVIIAASISGMILGLNLSTNTEHKVYGPKNPLAALLRNSSGFGVACAVVIDRMRCDGGSRSIYYAIRECLSHVQNR